MEDHHHHHHHHYFKRILLKILICVYVCVYLYECMPWMWEEPEEGTGSPGAGVIDDGSELTVVGVGI